MASAKRRPRIVLLAASILLAGSLLSASAESRPYGDTRVYAPIGAPGYPEGIAVDAGRGLLYVGTHAPLEGNGGAPPSKLFVFDLASHELAGEKEVEGQTLAATHGIQGLALDADGDVYALDRAPARVLRFDHATLAQSTYAAVPGDGAYPDAAAFDAAGNLYVTDFHNGTIWRVANGGGTPTAWFRDSRLAGDFGPNGIAIDPAGERIAFALTAAYQASAPGQGFVYSLPLVDSPPASSLVTLYHYTQFAAAPDGIAYGASGNLYVALAGASQVSVVAPSGVELARFPETPIANLLQPIPYDFPASLAFDGAGSLLVTNQAYVGGALHFAVLDAWVDDPGLPLVRPPIAR